MAKANPTGGKNYDPSESASVYDDSAPDVADETVQDPEAALQVKQAELAQIKTAEKLLEDQIARLTAHGTVYKALVNQLGDASIAAIAAARADLRKFVESRKKALDADMKKKIEQARKEVDAAISSAQSLYEAALKTAEQKRTALTEKQQQAAEAAAKYAATKELMPRVRQASNDLVGVRQKIEGLVKNDDFAAAGVWLYELDQQLTENPAPDKDQVAAALADAWKTLDAAYTETAAAQEAVTAAKDEESRSKKALEDSQKNRIATILESVKTAGPAVAGAT